jgi:uncharacterized membrane protein YdbT with pleckstrin-like domain
MSYPTKLLGDGEVIEDEMRPHWKSLLVPIVLTIATVVASSYLVGRLDASGFQGAIRTAVIVVAVIVVLVWAVKPFLDWLTTQYVFTNRRIIVRSGLLSRSGRDMPLSRVNNVTFDKSVMDRILNCGKLTVESAAENGTLVIDNVPNVESIQREVYRLYEEDDARRRGAGPMQRPSDGT